MNEPEDEVYMLSDLAHEFTQRWRQGERPSLAWYAERYPHLANEIRDLFPTLLLLESSHTSAAANREDEGSPRRKESPPEHLGEYRILREVGRGGMGVVFEAIHEPLGRRVAVKMLSSNSPAAATHMARFQREARAAATLQHSNIVPVYDVGEAEGMHFYAMQFIDGQSLAALLDQREEPMAFARNLERWRAAQWTKIAALTASPSNASQTTSPSVNTGGTPSDSMVLFSEHGRQAPYYLQIARMGRQVAEALAYAHREGVLHRDIKPSNLLVDQRGNVWVTDFGLAEVAGQEELTTAGDVVGTLRYLPPERLDGQMDQRGDIYSLGVTLYEMLSGRPAFIAGTRAELIDDILRARPVSLRRIDPRLPRDLETIVLKAMSPDPSQRYARADLLADDLHRFVTDRPISARPLGTWGHTWRWCRRNKPLATAIGLSAALLIAVFAISLVDSVRIRHLLREKVLARREARERTFESLVSQAHARWMGGNRYGRRFETLDVVTEAAALATELKLPPNALDRLRNEAIAALCLPDIVIDRTVDAFPMGTAVVDFEPKMQLYARADIEGNVTIHRVSDNRLLHHLLKAGPGYETDYWDGLAFSSSGTYLKHRCLDSRGKSCLRIWNISGVKPRLTLERIESISGETAFSTDGRHIAVVIHDSRHSSDQAANPRAQLHVFDVESGRDAATPVAADDSTRLVFHPSKAQLALSDATAVRIIRWETGEELSRWHRSGVQPMAWSPDSQQLLARSLNPTDAKIYRWDVQHDRELPPLEGLATRRPDRIVFNHRGTLFVSTSQHRLNLWEPRSGQVWFESGFDGLPGIKFSQDDQLLAGCISPYPKIRILRIADGLALRRLPLHSAQTHGFPRAVLSNNGRWLAATSNHRVVLLDLQTFEQLAVIPGVRLPLAFTTEGTLLTHADAPEGVVGWPIATTVDTISVGPPEPLSEVREDRQPFDSRFSGLAMWSSSRDGRVIATPRQRELPARILLATGGDRSIYRNIELGSQHVAAYTSVSPDGRYVATGSVGWWAKSGESERPVTVTVWDARTGQRITDLLTQEGAPQFSPDGKWIAVTSGSLPGMVRLWRVGSWKPAPACDAVEFPFVGQVAFEANSRLMAVQGHQLRLLIPETGREVALLSVPEETSLAPQCFTPDGIHLVACGVHNGHLYVWNLSAIRRQLDHLGLGWD